MTYEERAATQDLLGRYVEQPEPSVDGDWYVLDLQILIREGWTHIQIHFPHVDTDKDTDTPDAVSLIKDPDPPEAVKL
jgi:hypothetical protein